MTLSTLTAPPSAPTPAAEPMDWRTNAFALLGFALPVLPNFTLPPSPVIPNQIVAVIGVGLWLVWVCHACAVGGGRIPRAAVALIAALVLYAASAAFGHAAGPLPASLMAVTVAMCAVAAATVWIVAAAARAGQGVAVFRSFAFALVVVGLLSTVMAAIQIYGGESLQGDWLAPLADPSRAAANLRQPNHLATLLLWSALSAVWLGETGLWSRRWTALVVIALVFGVLLTGSRSAMVSLIVLALLGLVDRRASPGLRRLLIAMPIIYLVLWVALFGWAHVHGSTFAGEARVSTSGDISTKRFAVWSETFALLAQSPWTGVGQGEFNLAWTMTPFPDRARAFFDHTHNLALQIIVELGWPLGLLVLALVGAALVLAVRTAWRQQGLAGATTRIALAMLLVVGIHSQFEYPLWYSYFLLPTAVAFAICVAGKGEDEGDRHAEAEVRAAPMVRLPMVAALLVAAGGVLAAADYSRVVPIYATGFERVPLSERIARGERSWFFAHHADYAAATVAEKPSSVWPALEDAKYMLLDSRLMIAWAKGYAERGDVDRARFIAARLREFANPEADEFFAPCQTGAAAGAPRPFQCEAPQKRYNWRDFR